jgi:hypothetical protein
MENSPQILPQLVEMSKLLVLDVMIRTSIFLLCVCEFLIDCHFVYLLKKLWKINLEFWNYEFCKIEYQNCI